METVVLSKDEAKEFIQNSVQKTVQDEMPEILRRSRRKEWMTSKEVQEFLGISQRRLQYLRDSKDIPFSQSGRIIFYPTKELEDWLQDHMPEKWREKRKEADKKYSPSS